MNKIIKFGEDVEGYDIPVLNEREIRAAAGILFLLMFVSISNAAQGDFTLLKYAIIIFLVDMLIRVLINPKFAPTLIIGKWIVRNQTPEYVGARQKKFAWKIGIVLAVIMLVLVVIVNSFSPISGLICFICLIFLFFESAFGICLGCKVYPWFFKDKVQYCPGEVCEIKDRQPIQKTSLAQLFIVIAYVIFIVALYFLFNEIFSIEPFDLFGLEEKMNAH
ncbi:MAG: DUF4395 domain-containing protein [Bacteroidetes bacterium]|jgi:hypothetical protein|nr:DUF4395 domain-containing protein [Bacteroidota bacterium]MBT5527562.1 DUF4395 domain-containing protein [Cytophagia bacterium]MBT6753502.1 DUF4395 domain-containing protein [bacterium]MBT3421467.1 DUF4395 domain-containing protein [Bacteroidota bacterium]MBT3800963.1 DUF4395 domain-containing protein [Bacteroidota bacterium]